MGQGESVQLSSPDPGQRDGGDERVPEAGEGGEGKGTGPPGGPRTLGNKAKPDYMGPWNPRTPRSSFYLFPSNPLISTPSGWGEIQCGMAGVVPPRNP